MLPIGFFIGAEGDFVSPPITSCVTPGSVGTKLTKRKLIG